MIEKQESPQPTTDGQPEEKRVGPENVSDCTIESRSDDDVLVTEDHRASHVPKESVITFEEWLEARVTVGEISPEERQVELDAYSSPRNAHWKLVDDFYVGLEMAAEYLQEGHTLFGPEFQRSWVTLGKDSERPFAVVLREVAFLAERQSVDSTPLHLLLTNGPVTLQDLRGAQAVVARLLLRTDAVAAAAAQVSEPVAGGTDGEKPLPPKTTVAARMYDLIRKDSSTHTWTARQFAARLSCSPGSVAASPAWKELVVAREMKRQDAVEVSRHRGKPKWRRNQALGVWDATDVQD